MLLGEAGISHPGCQNCSGYQLSAALFEPGKGSSLGSDVSARHCGIWSQPRISLLHLSAMAKDNAGGTREVFGQGKGKAAPQFVAGEHLL